MLKTGLLLVHCLSACISSPSLLPLFLPLSSSKQQSERRTESKTERKLREVAKCRSFEIKEEILYFAFRVISLSLEGSFLSPFLSLSALNVLRKCVCMCLQLKLVLSSEVEASDF